MKEPLCLFMVGTILIGFGLWGFFKYFKLAQYIKNTPTAKIQSASQGYVELSGKLIAQSDKKIITPYKHIECVWYRCSAEKLDDEHKKSNRKPYENIFNNPAKTSANTVVSFEESSDDLLLNDSTGICRINPAGADLITHILEWRDECDGLLYTLEYLCEGDTLYALGYFETRSDSGANITIDSLQKDLLSQWKKDPATLLKRFDINKDSEINTKEWDLARLAARLEAENQFKKIMDEPQYHCLRKHDNQKLPYILTNIREQAILKKLNSWSVISTILCFIGTGFILTSLTMAHFI